MLDASVHVFCVWLSLKKEFFISLNEKYVLRKWMQCIRILCYISNTVMSSRKSIERLSGLNWQWWLLPHALHSSQSLLVPLHLALHQLYEGGLSSPRLFPLHLLPRPPPPYPPALSECPPPLHTVVPCADTSTGHPGSTICCVYASFHSEAAVPPGGYLRHMSHALSPTAGFTGDRVRVDPVLFAGPLSEQLKRSKLPSNAELCGLNPVGLLVCVSREWYDVLALILDSHAVSGRRSSARQTTQLGTKNVTCRQKSGPKKGHFCQTLSLSLFTTRFRRLPKALSNITCACNKFGINRTPYIQNTTVYVNDQIASA